MSDTPATAVAGGCEPPDVDAGNPAQFLWTTEQYVLITTRSSLQPLEMILF